MPHPKKIFDGYLDGGVLLSIPIHSQNDFSPVERFGGTGDPNVVDSGRPFYICQDNGLSGFDGE